MVKHLPFPVKQLLATRNPDSFAGPPLTRLHDLFAGTLRDAKRRNAETGWLVLTTCTLLTLNRPSCVNYLYKFATRTDPSKVDSRRGLSEAQDKAALMREAALKSAIFVGVPRVILTLAALTEALEDDVKASLRKDSLRAANERNIGAIVARGRKLWDSIYEPHADKLYSKLGSYHPDFISFIIQSYGAVLAPLPSSGTTELQGNLSRALGSVVGVACLRAEGRVEPQLVSHAFGLLKARYTEGQSPEDVWLSSDEGTEWVIRTVDKTVDGVTVEQELPQSRVKL